MKIWVQPHGLAIQVKFRWNQIHATEMQIRMCLFGSETPIWGSAKHSNTQIDFRRDKLRHGNTFTNFGSSSRETAVSRDRCLKLSMAISYTIRDSFPFLGRHQHALLARLRIETKICKDHGIRPHLTD